MIIIMKLFSVQRKQLNIYDKFALQLILPVSSNKYNKYYPHMVYHISLSILFDRHQVMDDNFNGALFDECDVPVTTV